MTNKEAIEIINRVAMNTPVGDIVDKHKDFYEALDLAIKALEEYPTDKEIQDDMRRTYLGGKE